MVSTRIPPRHGYGSEIVQRSIYQRRTGKLQTTILKKREVNVNNFEKRNETIKRVQLDDVSREIKRHEQRVAELKREGCEPLARAEMSLLTSKRRQRLDLLADDATHSKPASNVGERGRQVSREEMLRKKRG